MAHELAHVKNRDILISSVAATIAAAIMMAARFAMFFGGGRSDDREGGSNPLALIAMMILAPIAAMLIQAAISRSREFAADAGGAQIAGSPHGLASALRKLESAQKQIPMDANPATAHMFIIKPFCDLRHAVAVQHASADRTAHRGADRRTPLSGRSHPQARDSPLRQPDRADGGDQRIQEIEQVVVEDVVTLSVAASALSTSAPAVAATTTIQSALNGSNPTRQAIRPMTKAAAMPAAVPSSDIAPGVPGATLASVVTSTVFPPHALPISLATVSLAPAVSAAVSASSAAS